MKISVRDMQTRDVAGVYDCMVKLFEESALPGQDIDFKKGLDHLYALADAPTPTHKVFVAVQDDKIIGVMKCFLSTYWYSKDVRAVHEILYVVPEARGTDAALSLIGTFEGWAHAAGAIHCATSAFLDDPEALAAFRRLMKNASYDCIGALYKKDLTNVRR